SFIDSYSSVLQPTKVELKSVESKELTVLEYNDVSGSHPSAHYKDKLVKPRFGTLKAKDDQTLHYRAFEPAQLEKGKKYPVVVGVYGGPGAQRVTNSWSAKDLYCQYLAQNGYIVFQLDNRGSENRGKAFEDPIYKKLAVVELDDQITGV